MEKSDYIVCRDNIYVGEVVKPYNVYYSERENDFWMDSISEVYTTTWMPYRSMLFVLTEEKLSNDLLYKSPCYPIFNVTDDDICLNVNHDSIVIKESYNLTLLLEYLGYSKELTYEDIVKIRKTLFSGNFSKEKLFQLLKHKTITGVAKMSFPREYYDILNKMGDHSLIDVLKGNALKIDAFTPHEQEGPVKKLTKFKR